MGAPGRDDHRHVILTHSSRKRLKYILPICLFLTLGIIIFWPNIQNYFKEEEILEEMPVLMKETESDDSGLVQNQARELHFNGTDSNKQPYTLTAKEGVEYTNQRTELIDPHLILKLNTGASVDLKADKATLYKEQQKVELTGRVKLKHTSGYEFSTSRAWMDLNSSSAFGHDPIEGHGPNGKIFATGGFRLYEKGDKIMFNGRPELTLQKSK